MVWRTLVWGTLIGTVWVRWGSIFYSWLGMSSIQHEIFIESIYNNQKLSILREYSITSCDHQTIFFMLLLPFYRFAREAFISDWSANQDQPDEKSRSGPSFCIWNIVASRILKNIFFKLGTRQIFFSISGFLDNDDQIFRKLEN